MALLSRQIRSIINSFKVGDSEKVIEQIIKNLYNTILYRTSYGFKIELSYGYVLSINVSPIKRAEYDALYLLSAGALQSLHRYFDKIPQGDIGFNIIDLILRIIIPYISEYNRDRWVSVQKVMYNRESLIFAIEMDKTVYMQIQFDVVES